MSEGGAGASIYGFEVLLEPNHLACGETSIGGPGAPRSLGSIARSCRAATLERNVCAQNL